VPAPRLQRLAWQQAKGDLEGTSSVALLFILQIRIPARLHAFGLPRHLRGATVLMIMLSCIDAACEHQPCGRLSGRVLGADQMLAPPLLKLTLVAEGDDHVKAFTHARYKGI